MMNNEEIKNEFINCIEGTHTLNLAISVLEDREEYKKEIERLNNIINELEKHFEFLKMNSTGGNKEFMEDILEYIKALKELKGSDKE